MTDPNTARRAAGCSHPSLFIAEELKERGWDLDRLAIEMGGDFGINRLSLDMYFEVGPTEPNLLLGLHSADQLALAFGTSAEFWRNLHTIWRRSLVRGVA